MLLCVVSHRLSLEWPPDNSSISHGELGEPIARQYLSVRDVKSIHDGDDVVVASAGPLDVLEELIGDEIVHVATKVGGMQGDPALHVVEEEHCERMTGSARRARQNSSRRWVEVMRSRSVVPSRLLN